MPPTPSAGSGTGFVSLDPGTRRIAARITITGVPADNATAASASLNGSMTEMLDGLAHALDRVVRVTKRGRDIPVEGHRLRAGDPFAGDRLHAVGVLPHAHPRHLPADPALALGPAMAHFGWALDDWDRIAGATMVTV